MPRSDDHPADSGPDTVPAHLLDEVEAAASRSPSSQPAGRRGQARMLFPLVVSLAFHALLLSLSFGGDGVGLPGFDLPWRDRRAEPPALHVVLAPPRLVPMLPAPAAATDARAAEATSPPPSGAPSMPAPAAAAGAVPDNAPTATAVPQAGIATDAPPSVRADEPAAAAPAAIPAPPVIAVPRSDEPAWVVPPSAPAVPVVAASAPAPVVAAAWSASAPASTPSPTLSTAADEAREQAIERARFDRLAREAQRQSEQAQAARAEAARLDADRQDSARRLAAQQEAALQQAAHEEAARVEAARADAARTETARQAALRQETARQQAAREEAARVDADRAEAARQQAARDQAARAEAARVEAERQEAARQAAARQEAARKEAARVEAARAESAKAESAKAEAARQAAASQDAARLQAEQDDNARRDAARRAYGKQLDDEADRRDAAAAASRLPALTSPALPSSLSTARRGRLFGRTDPNAELILYAEAWARKIQLNVPVEQVRELSKRPHTQPLVTVAIRRDGSVESVTFVLSSGVAEVDEAIRRIVQGQAPYPAFSPGLAREYDVIEIRRTWNFDTAVRLN